MGELVVDGRRIDEGEDCYVIAEVGHNHQGSIHTAKELFRAAKECGADAVKLQKRDNRSLYTRELYDQPYDHENSFAATYGLHREALEFGREEYEELQEYAREINITLFATPFDFASADFLADLDVPAYKIASGDLQNTPLLRYVATFGKPMFVSTGGASLEDVERAYDTVTAVNPQICLLQCTASYPCDPQTMNLRVIQTYREFFPDAVAGLSDHQSGIAMAVAAYVLGAQVIEKHFTLNRAMRGTDHAFSLEPAGLRKLVRDLHRARSALGDRVKRPIPCEEKHMFKMGKKIVAAREIEAGHLISWDDLAIKSPNNGLPPYEMENVIGRVTARPLKVDEAITFDDLLDVDFEPCWQYAGWSTL
jgi:sialic acid synthase